MRPMILLLVVASGMAVCGVQGADPAIVPETAGAGVYMRLSPGPVTITRVVADSPAARAGLQPRDQIVSLNGQKVTSPAQVSQVVASMKPSELISIEIRRNGESISRPMKLGLKRQVFARRAYSDASVETSGVFTSSSSPTRGGIPGSYGRDREGSYGTGGAAVSGTFNNRPDRDGIPGSFGRNREGSYGHGGVATWQNRDLPLGVEGISNSYGSSDQGSYGRGSVR